MTSSSTAFGQQPMVIFQDDFESGPGDWFANNGVWEVGTPTVGPDSCYSPTMCAGTVLNGNYPNNANTRFISPEIALPSLQSGEKIQLRFWHWFSLINGDFGRVQISVDGGEWRTISDPLFDQVSGAWTQFISDSLSNYANSKVRIGFLFTSDGGSTLSGWYLDDVEIVKGPVTFRNPENFELGINNWFADNGVWEVGSPTVGPDSCHSPTTCAGTVLDGDYPNNANTRFISSEITLPDLQNGERIQLKFWHWFSLINGDFGRVQISVDGGEWRTISDPPFANVSGAWTQFISDSLSNYANSKVRIGFLFTSDGGGTSSGWYFDDVVVLSDSGIIDIVEIPDSNIPSKFELSQNYPNPFNPTTTINYQLPKSSPVTLTIYNLLGREITKLVNETQSVGEHIVQWDGRDHDGNEVSSGLYLYRLTAGSFHQTSRMLLLR